MILYETCYLIKLNYENQFEIIYFSQLTVKVQIISVNLLHVYPQFYIHNYLLRLSTLLFSENCLNLNWANNLSKKGFPYVIT